MRVFLSRYGIYLSKFTVHKYMNKMLNLASIIMRKKPGYKSGHKHKIFDNLLKQDFTISKKNKVWCTDFTYMRQTNGRFKYNCTIIDLYEWKDFIIHLFKNCFYYRFTFDNVEMLDKMTKQFINWYNYVRPHTYNNNLTPMELRFS